MKFLIHKVDPKGSNIAESVSLRTGDGNHLIIPIFQIRVKVDSQSEPLLNRITIVQATSVRCLSVPHDNPSMPVAFIFYAHWGIALTRNKPWDIRSNKVHDHLPLSFHPIENIPSDFSRDDQGSLWTPRDKLTWTSRGILDRMFEAAIFLPD